MSPEERIGHAVLAGWTLRFTEIPATYHGSPIYMLAFKRPGHSWKRVRMSGRVPEPERWETILLDEAGVPRYSASK